MCFSALVHTFILQNNNAVITQNVMMSAAQPQMHRIVQTNVMLYVVFQMLLQSNDDFTHRLLDALISEMKTINYHLIR